MAKCHGFFESRRQRRYHGHPAKADSRTAALKDREAFEPQGVVRLVKREAIADPRKKRARWATRRGGHAGGRTDRGRTLDLDDGEHREDWPTT